MANTDANELRALLTEAARTGEAPRNAAMGLTLHEANLQSRKELRHTLQRAIETAAKAKRNGDSAEDIADLIDHVVTRHGGGNEKPDVASIPRDGVSWKTQRQGEAQHAERTELHAMADVLNHATLRGKPLSDLELDQLPVNPSLTRDQARQWRSEAKAASKRVVDLFEAGNQGDAHVLANDLAGPLSGGLKFAEHVDPGAHLTNPDKLADHVYRKTPGRN